MSTAIVTLPRYMLSLGRGMLMALALAACSAGGKGPYWGADATAAPGWDRIADAALKAAIDPFTWVPAVGAAALQIEDIDDEIADWANDETPLFGARETAADVSDGLQAASVALYVGAGLAAPAPDGDWLATKAKGFAVGAAAIGATIGTTTLLKETTARDRPLNQDDGSLPSGHASLAAVSARLTHETLRYDDLSCGARIATDVGLAGLALTTGWARVEAGEHHPADVLVGAALGNFIAVFATEAFLRPALGETIALRARTHGNGMALQVSVAY